MRGANIYVLLEDLLANVSVNQAVHFYGAKDVLGEFMLHEIVNRYDADELLEEIGDEKIIAYYNEHIKKDGAA